jgi:hypothetical protein
MPWSKKNAQRSVRPIKYCVVFLSLFAAANGFAGSWSVSTTTDKMTDETRTSISSYSINTLDGWLRRGKVKLAYSCGSGFYLWAHDMGFVLGGGIRRARIDNRDAIELRFSTWDSNNDGMSMRSRTYLGSNPDSISELEKFSPHLIYVEDHSTKYSSYYSYHREDDFLLLEQMMAGNRMQLEVVLFNTKNRRQIAQFDLSGFTSAISQCPKPNIITRRDEKIVATERARAAEEIRLEQLEAKRREAAKRAEEKKRRQEEDERRYGRIWKVIRDARLHPIVTNYYEEQLPGMTDSEISAAEVEWARQVDRFVDFEESADELSSEYTPFKGCNGKKRCLKSRTAKYEKSMSQLMTEYSDVTNLIAFSPYVHDCGKRPYSADLPYWPFSKKLDEACLRTQSLSDYKEVAQCELLNDGEERQYDSYGDSYSQLVAATQEHLVALGFEVGTVDGELNDQTRLAIQQYQLSVGLRESGLPSKALLENIEKDVEAVCS